MKQPVRLPWKLLALGIAAAGTALAVWVAHGRGELPAEGFAEGGARELEALYPAPDFAFPDQRGQTVTARALHGKVWVANFIFTQCRTICPLLTAKMAQLQRQLEGVDARFVSFSVDPEHDTPEVLAAYARHWRPEEQRWALLSTAPATLAALADGFHVAAMKSDAGPDEDPILHSAIFLLVDGEGQVRGVYDSERPEDFARLEGHVRRLAKAGPPPPAEVSSGEALFHELSCVGCHERPELAPLLGGLAGTRRALTHGATAVFDEAYVRESILVPEARRVAGYPLRMPTYQGLVDDAALGRLARYVLALPARAQADAGEVSVETDPVCGMQVRATADALHAERGGKTYWFCAARCQQRFLAHPEAYLEKR